MPTTIKDIREAMTRELVALHAASQKHSIGDEKLAKAIEQIAGVYKKLLDEKTDNLNTRGTSYSVMNQMVVRLFGKKFYTASISILKLTKDQMEHVKGQQAKNTVHHNENRVVIDGRLYHELIGKLKHGDRVQELATCLALATGRRPGEIAKTGSFAPYHHHDDQHHHDNNETNTANNTVWFTGQLKKRGKETDGYNIPVLVLTPAEAIAIMKRLRQLQKESEYKDDGVRTAAGISRTIYAAFGPSVTPETIRGAYAFICYRVYSLQKIPEALYDARILGHGSSSNPDTTVSANHYQRAVVVHWPGAPIPDLFLDPKEIAQRHKKQS
jgi:Telomere resolvase